MPIVQEAQYRPASMMPGSHQFVVSGAEGLQELVDNWAGVPGKHPCTPLQIYTYLGGISLDVKRLKMWDFYPVFFGFS